MERTSAINPIIGTCICYQNNNKILTLYLQAENIQHHTLKGTVHPQKLFLNI